MRLFVGVDLEGLADPVADAQAPFRGLPGLNPTDPEGAHVTVKFLGDGDHDLEALSGAIERAVDVAGVGPFDASFEGLGAFPSPDYISVVWLGVEGRGTGGPSARSRGSAARGHHREQCDRGAWFERRDASFVSAGNLRFPACGQNPQDSGNITRERRSLGRQRILGVERAEGFLDSSIRI